MNINGKANRTIWLADDGSSVEIIDQTKLPHALVVVPLRSMEEAARAILTMQVRGAPLIGATAAYGVAWRCGRTPPTRPSIGPSSSWPSSARPRSTCAGRWRRCGAACQNLPHASASPRPTGARPRSATRTSRPAAASASMGSSSSATSPRASSRASRSTCSPTATPAGSPASTGAPRPRPSTRRTTPASPCMCGSTRRGRAIRARRSPRSSSAATACPTPSSSTTPAAT